MDQAILVTEHIEAGRTLLRELDAAGVPVTAAYWFQSFDQTSWHLVISSPKLDEDATFTVHGIVNDIIRTKMVIPPLIGSLEPHLMGEHSPIIVNLRAFAPTGDATSIRERRITGESVGSSYIVGAYLYRVKQLVPETGVERVTFAFRLKKEWRTWEGELEFKDGRLVDVRTEDPTIRDVSIGPKAHPEGLSVSLSTVERVTQPRGRHQTLLRRWRFLRGKLTHFEEVIDSLPLNKQTNTAQKSI